jgi:hypothetical protein
MKVVAVLKSPCSLLIFDDRNIVFNVCILGYPFLVTNIVPPEVFGVISQQIN